MSAAGARPARDILEFWFSERARPLWFEKNQAFDEEIRIRFATTLELAAAGALDGWTSDPDSCLALVIVLDQFSRNSDRGSARAFAADPTARDQALRQMTFVHRHAEIIERFGRFPHRNEILGRESSPQEIEFLKQPNSSF